MSDKLPVSVCMLCHNEIDRFKITLEPLKHFEEWIIYDSGSTDGSVDFATSKGAKVTNCKWEGFSRTKIKMFKSANQPWILWVDADELITEEIILELKTLFNSDLNKYDAYYLNRMIKFEDKWIKHGDWFPDWNVRLFKHDKWVMEDRLVHESVKVEGEKGYIKNYLEHYSFRSWEEKENKSRKYAQLWADMKVNNTRHVNFFMPFMRCMIKFLRGYLLKLGIMDGKIGLKIALSNAKETYLKYFILRNKIKNNH